MTVYQLANPEYRNNVDLTKYKKLIEKLVTDEVPDAMVIVKETQYYVSPDLTRGQAIRIGRAIASSEIGKYTMSRPSLFVGKKISERKEESE